MKTNDYLVEVFKGKAKTPINKQTRHLERYNKKSEEWIEGLEQGLHQDKKVRSVSITII